MIKEPLLRKSGIVFAFTIVASFLDYLYQVYVGRYLGPEDYGVFASLFAIFYLISVISNTIATSITNFISKFSAEERSIPDFFSGMLFRFIFIGVIFSGIFLILSPFISRFLKIKDLSPFLVLTAIVLFAWSMPVLNGTLRGLQKFKELGIVRVSNSLAKLIFGVVFLLLGFKVMGALLGVLLGFVFASLVSMIFLKKYLKFKPKLENFGEVCTYSLPVLIAMFSLSLPSNFDLLIVKNLLTEKEAGLYASACLFGKIVYFFPSSIYVVLFPMVAEKFAKGESTTDILIKSLTYTAILTGGVVFIYFIYPDILVKFFGKKYMEAIPLIAPYGLAMLFFSLSSIFLNYSLAIKDYKYVVFFSMVTLGYIILLYFNPSLMSMIRILLYGNMVLFIVSCVYRLRC
ncbi:MAG: hypothetical protein DRN95_02085 [Candidatus Hydrothermarchaeota archaeon]|nr:MAG: hypothetical protein DRN95_02085 [Candidatus Hydrothermarchaeota archaeon]